MFFGDEHGHLLNGGFEKEVSRVDPTPKTEKEEVKTDLVGCCVRFAW